MRGYPGYDPDDEWTGFQWAFDADDGPWAEHLWLHAEEYGEVDRVADLVQKFLKQFRPQECWSLGYAVSCSKPRVGEFGGGAVFVTARGVSWDSTDCFLEKKRAAFEKRMKPGRKAKAFDAGRRARAQRARNRCPVKREKRDHARFPSGQT